MTGTSFSHGKSALKRPYSLPESEWPDDEAPRAISLR
jgi:hypothetical protein